MNIFRFLAKLLGIPPTPANDDYQPVPDTWPPAPQDCTCRPGKYDVHCRWHRHEREIR